MQRNLPQILLFLLIGLTVWSAIGPHDTQVWWTEMTAVILLLSALACTWRRFRFSNTAYVCMGIWCAMQIIGAHYTFELVPIEPLSQLFGASRNHYDRAAHFAVGLGGIAIAELLWHRHLVSSPACAAWFSVVFMLGIAAAWEIMEWAYAAIEGGSAGQAFLGTQGDIWDAQKDMLLDTAGAILAACIFYLRRHRTHLR